MHLADRVGVGALPPWDLRCLGEQVIILADLLLYSDGNGACRPASIGFLCLHMVRGSRIAPKPVGLAGFMVAQYVILIHLLKKGGGRFLCHQHRDKVCLGVFCTLQLGQKVLLNLGARMCSVG